MGISQTEGPSAIHKVFSRQSSVKVAPDMATPTTSTTDDFLEMGKGSHMLLFGGIAKPVPCEECEDDVGLISVMRLYNGMNDGQLSPYKFDPSLMLIVDTRLVEDFNQLHIITSYHADVIEQEQNLLLLETYDMIILYDAQGLPQNYEDSILGSTFQKMKKQNPNTFALEGGFDAFQNKHPYLCSSKDVSSEIIRQNLIGNYPSAVLEDQLYLGGADQAGSAQVLQDLMITHILNITEESFIHVDNSLKCMNISVLDDYEADLLNELPKAIIFINKALKEGGRLLVHCKLGVSRSSTVVLAYLMYSRHWTLMDALGFLRKRRPIIQPNSHFMEQLQQYEEMLFGERISDVPC